MKIVLTGSIGHIGKPLTKTLVSKGHSVTVISSHHARKKEIDSLGATAAIGSIEDTSFLTSAFSGADAVYCMEPPVNFFDKALNIVNYYEGIGKNYRQAIERAEVTQVIHLSSIGAHREAGNGILRFHHRVEQVLRSLPDHIRIKFIRPVGFYDNLFSMIRIIQSQGVMASVYGEEDVVPWVATADIAEVIAEEFERPFRESREVRYVASDELSCREIARVLGQAIGKPGLEWVIISEQQQLDGLLAAGMSSEAATGLVEMNTATHTGVLYEDYYLHPPTLGNIKIQDFAHEFAKAYHHA